MHEYGIVQSLLSQVDDQVWSHQGRRAVRVELAIDGGHVDERFLRAAFDTFKVESTARSAELIITQAPTEVWCPSCEARLPAADREPICPSCGGACVRVDLSNEIYLKSVEIEV